MRQRITAVDEATTSGKQSVNEKDDLFSHLPVNVSEEGYDLYDGLSGYFRDTFEFEGKKATMEVTLVDLPPILQIQLQVGIFLLSVTIKIHIYSEYNLIGRRCNLTSLNLI